MFHQCSLAANQKPVMGLFKPPSVQAKARLTYVVNFPWPTPACRWPRPSLPALLAAPALCFASVSAAAAAPSLPSFQTLEASLNSGNSAPSPALLAKAPGLDPSELVERI